MNDPDAITLLMWIGIVGTPAAIYLLAERHLAKQRRGATYIRSMPRWKVLMRRWVRQRNETKLKREMGWRTGWQR